MDESEFEIRKQAMSEECVVAPGIFQKVELRLKEFMEPFVTSLT